MVAIKVGDTVTVPGDMHGLVKFVGRVAGKAGTFAGVQLASEYSGRGKNSGDVDGKFYFRTTIQNSGIFLPIEKAVKRTSGPSSGIGAGRATPGTPTRLTSFNQGGRTPTATKPSFSQSVGPGALRNGAASPALKAPLRRESLPRPSSPLRKVNTPAAKALQTPKTRPSMAKSTIGQSSTYRSGAAKPPNKFSQSLRHPSTAPAQAESPTLGPELSFDEVPEEESESTPTPTPAISRNRDSADSQKHEAEKQRLQKQLDEKSRALQEQAISISEMERNLTELQNLMPGLSEGAPGLRSSLAEEDEDLPKDVVNLRATLREKNEKIKLLTVEFDANRADFRSTIDTLEMASTETERVYEKRVDELLEEVRNLQDRSEDVESVAQQLRQLEELVQELEEGLEEARRSEAEARGEVEFLRGEVERSRSELRRERDRIRTEEQLNGYGGGSADGERIDELQAHLDGKEDEIRGLKAIIHNLNSATATPQKPKTNGVHRNQHLRQDSSSEDPVLQQQIRDLEALLQQKSAHEEELEHEVKQLRSSVHLSKFPMPGSNFGLRPGHSRNNSDDLRKNLKHASSGTQGSQRTVVLSPNSERKEFYDASSQVQSPVKSSFDHHNNNSPAHANRDDVSSDAGKSEGGASSTAALWCEICEENGHDILTCGNMISGSSKPNSQPSHSHNASIERPAPLMSRKSNLSVNSNPSRPPTQALPQPPVLPSANTPMSPAFPISVQMHQEQEDEEEGSQKELKAPIEGTGEQAGMWAGKSSGVIDPDKWCALCERDGHESVDCPIEDAF